MIRINQIKLRPDHTEEDLDKHIRRTLKLDKNSSFEYEIRKKSIDSRKKPDIFYIYAVNVITRDSNEVKLVSKLHDNNVMLTDETSYSYNPPENADLDKKIVIAGFGPAGLFCAQQLSRWGLKPIVIERGLPVEERQKAVEEFWNTGKLNTDSNVQFGEGGAGTFSDGKLNTMVKEKSGRIRKVLETFVDFGADSSILYLNKPHIGTDILCNVVRNMRNGIISNGGKVLFGTCLKDIVIENGRVKGIYVNDGQYIECDRLVLAIGHSARDTFTMLNEHKVHMEQKSFAVGLRVEHPQEIINNNSYGTSEYELPVADYKVTAKASNGKGVYSFCMCPGGYVVNASSEEGMLAVNGMSYSDRGSSNANSAIVVTVGPEDFGSEDILAGMYFQRDLESKAYRVGNSKVPVQLNSDFQNNIASTKLRRVTPCIKGEYSLTNLRQILPESVSEAIVDGMKEFDRHIAGFNMEDAVFSGVESRTSSPVRITRNDDMESVNVKGMFPCGEGAGYAGGITSAAVDGIKTAEAVIESLCSDK